MIKTLAGIGMAGFLFAAHVGAATYNVHGALRPLSGDYSDNNESYFEVLGKGPGGDYSEYFLVDARRGSVESSVLDYAYSLASQEFAKYPKTESGFTYEASANPTLQNQAGSAYYPIESFNIGVGSNQVLFGSFNWARYLYVRDRGALRQFALSARGDGYPPDVLAGGNVLSFSDPSPPEYRADLRQMMSGACCSDLELSAPGPLPVVLRAPEIYRPVYMGLQLTASRDPGLSPVDGLPAALQLADYDVDRTIYVIFGGHFTFTVNDADYASTEEFLAARSWIDANVSLVNLEVAMNYDITSLQLVSAPVPEPTTAALLAAGGLLLVLRRRQRRTV